MKTEIACVFSAAGANPAIAKDGLWPLLPMAGVWTSYNPVLDPQTLFDGLTGAEMINRSFTLSLARITESLSRGEISTPNPYDILLGVNNQVWTCQRKFLSFARSAKSELGKLATASFAFICAERDALTALCAGSCCAVWQKKSDEIGVEYNPHNLLNGSPTAPEYWNAKIIDPKDLKLLALLTKGFVPPPHIPSADGNPRKTAAEYAFRAMREHNALGLPFWSEPDITQPTFTEASAVVIRFGA